MRIITVADLPDAPLAAAADFHARILPGLSGDVAENDMLLVFAHADHRHRGWRQAVVAGLARAAAPRHRVNALADAGAGDPAVIAATAAFLAASPGITGQLLALDGTGAGDVLFPPS